MARVLSFDEFMAREEKINESKKSRQNSNLKVTESNSIRIDYNKGYLYCNVSDNPSDYCDMYDSSEECFNDLKDDILTFCKKNRYNKLETNAVLNYYQIKFNNYSGEWKDKY